MRSAGIHAICAFQSFNQLEGTCGYSHKQAENLLDMFGTKVILSVSDSNIAKQLSDSLGTYSARTTSHSRSKGANSYSVGINDSIMRHPLLSQDELMRWQGAEHGSLVIINGEAHVFPLKDVPETFLANELGMTSKENERKLMSRSIERNAICKNELPPVWYGKIDSVESNASNLKIGVSHTPEDF